MSRQFKQLIEELCMLVGMRDPQHLMHSGPFQADGVIFTLARDWLAEGEVLLLQGDCGVPQHDQHAVHAALLQRNYASFQHDGPLFAISPQSGGIVYMERMKVTATSASALAGTLAFVARHARYWRCALPMPPRPVPRLGLPCLQLA